MQIASTFWSWFQPYHNMLNYEIWYRIYSMRNLGRIHWTGSGLPLNRYDVRIIYFIEVLTHMFMSEIPIYARRFLLEISFLKFVATICSFSSWKRELIGNQITRYIRYNIHPDVVWFEFLIYFYFYVRDLYAYSTHVKLLFYCTIVLFCRYLSAFSPLSYKEQVIFHAKINT